MSKSTMSEQTILDGTVHKMPADLRRLLVADESALEIWNDITPLARNEWICWVESVKLDKTRSSHLKRVTTELLQGKRRPCCWMGCNHRQKNAR